MAENTEQDEPEVDLGGRPEIPIDEDKVIDLAEIGCTNETIADKCKCSVTTLKRRFGPQLKLARAEGHIALLRVQHKTALAGDVKMLIWQGKNRLGQSDKQELKVETTTEIILDRRRKDPNADEATDDMNEG